MRRSPPYQHTIKLISARHPQLIRVKMHSIQLRQKLNKAIFRNRRRPYAEPFISTESFETDNLQRIMIPEEWQKFSAREQAFGQRTDQILWERVKLSLDDDSDPSQTDLNLILARKAELSPPYRTIVLLHGTGNCSTTAEMLHNATRFIVNDFMVVLLNSRYHGCRAGEGFAGRERYAAELVKAWKNNETNGKAPLYPFIYDTSADLASVADYLLSRADVCDHSLGITGVSLGGMHAWFASAADERWKAVAPLIGVQSFNYAVDKECFHARVDTIREIFSVAACDEGHQTVTSNTVRAVWNRLCPGLLEDFDAQFSLPLLFPRPVFIANGELDPRCPIEGVRAAVEIATKTCVRTWGAKGNFELHVYRDLGHEVSEQMWTDCVGFFVRVFLQDSSRQMYLAKNPSDTNLPADST